MKKEGRQARKTSRGSKEQNKKQAKNKQKMGKCKRERVANVEGVA
jgi:hypothetical protein